MKELIHFQVLEGFFHLLRLTLKNADRAVLPTLLKTIFAFFLDVFDLRNKLSSKSFDAEVSYVFSGLCTRERKLMFLLGRG